MNLSLEGKTAVVCGSTRGIGKAAAIELASLGATIVLIARNEDLLKETKSELKSNYNQIHTYLIADFAKPDDLKIIINEWAAKNTAHILINNTGGPPGGSLLDAGLDDFMNAISAHLFCNHILAQALIPGMKKVKYGRIINIISTSVKEPIKGLGVSNTTRGAVASWAKTLSNEVASFGITVNNVLPGFTNTGRLKQIIDSKAEKTNVSDEIIIKEMLSIVPADRFAEPEEVASLIAFLATEAASYINGTSIQVDGGRMNSI